MFHVEHLSAQYATGIFNKGNWYVVFWGVSGYAIHPRNG